MTLIIIVYVSCTFWWPQDVVNLDSLTTLICNHVNLYTFVLSIICRIMTSQQYDVIDVTTTSCEYHFTTVYFRVQINTVQSRSVFVSSGYTTQHSQTSMPPLPNTDRPTKIVATQKNLLPHLLNNYFSIFLHSYYT